MRRGSEEVGSASPSLASFEVARFRCLQEPLRGLKSFRRKGTTSKLTRRASVLPFRAKTPDATSELAIRASEILETNDARFRNRLRPVLAIFLMGVCTIALPLQAADSAPAKLLIAFTSLRERPLYTVVHFYEHDGSKTGKIVGKIATLDNRSDHHPALSRDGKLCVFAAEVVGKVSSIQYWDIGAKKTIALPSLNKTPNTQMAPSISSDGHLIAFEAWNRPGSAGRWDVMLYDHSAKKLLDTPNLNSSPGDERKPALSRDGRWIAFTTNASDGAGQTDIRLYDRKTGQILMLPKLNSPHTDTEPSLSADGRLIAFVSNRPMNDRLAAGTRDIYLYDRASERLLPLPGLNSPGQEQSPSLSADGRFLAFVSERLDSAGERDIFVYDRETKTLLPTPGLNSPKDEYDPCVIVVGKR